jgi:NitT/TauT family transport system substrate-binding protein
MLRPSFAFIIGLATLLAGCDRHTAAPGAGDASAPALAEVRIGFFPNLTHSQAVLGVGSGEFAAAIAPAKLTVRPFNAGPSLIEALFNNQVDIGYVGPGPVTSAFARSHGQGIRVISGAAADGVVIVARAGSGINSLSDLAGKKIATPQHANTQDIAARHYLTATLHQKDTANVLPVPNADQAGAMARGDIDAAWSPEPWGSLLISQAGAKAVGEEKDLWPNREFSLTLVVTTPDFLAVHPDIVEKMLRVHHAWTQRLAADPARYVGPLEDELAKLTGRRLPAGVTAAALAHVKFTDEPLADSLQSYAQWGYELGLTQQPPALDGLTDLTILHKVQAQAPTTQP